MDGQNPRDAISTRLIEIFLAVIKVGTVSRAAETLGISQPAVSRAIADLERALGFLLFDRVKSRIVATPEGMQFLAEVELHFRGMDKLRASAARIRDHGAGQIRIGSLSALASALVPRAIARFRSIQPSIAVTLMVQSSRDIRDGVAAGAFDLGLAADEIDTTGVSYQPFVSPAALCAIPQGHPLAEYDVIRPHHLSGVDFIEYVPEDRARQRFHQVMHEAGMEPPRTVVETIYATTVCTLVAEGVGVGLVHPHVLPALNIAGVVLRPFEPEVRIKSLLLLPLGRPKSNLVRDFIDCLMVAR